MYENALNDVKILGIICLICSVFFGMLSIGEQGVSGVFDKFELAEDEANLYRATYSEDIAFVIDEFVMNKGLKYDEQDN